MEEESSSLILLILLPVKVSVAALTVLLNPIIIVVAGVLLKKKTYTNCLFLSVAVSDLLVGLISLTSMTLFTTRGFWPLALCVLGDQ
jgi:hypothetical protein